MTTTPLRIDPRLGAAALRAPAASMKDSCPQAILKFQPCNSFDYKVRYKPQLTTQHFSVLHFQIPSWWAHQLPHDQLLEEGVPSKPFPARYYLHRAKRINS